MTLVSAQVEPVNGLHHHPPGVWALTGATVYTTPANKLENAIIVIRDGFIEEVGRKITIPKDATEIEMTGMTIYPGFIESWMEIPLDDSYKVMADSHWNFKVHADRNMSKLYVPDTKKLEKYHKMGFTAAHVVPDSGIFKGTSSLLQLNKEGSVLSSSVSQIIGYEVDGWGSDKYPNALLGVVALIRQSLSDGNWYKETEKKTTLYSQINAPLKKNRDLEIIGKWRAEKLPFIFETNHELTALRSKNIAQEFNIQYWIKGSGYEYRRISELSGDNPYIILPLDFPALPQLSHPYQELSYSTAELKHWDLAPGNPAALSKSGIPFSLTAFELSEKDFRKNLHKSIERGLQKKEALAALTTIPADKMGVSKILGKIKPQFLANMTVVSGDYFDKNSKVISTWIGGVEYPVIPPYTKEVAGDWILKYENMEYHLHLIKKGKAYSGKLEKDTTEFKLSNLKVEGSYINWTVQWDSTAVPMRFTGHIIEDAMEGAIPSHKIGWTAIKAKDQSEKMEKKSDKQSIPDYKVNFPDGTYGTESYPPPIQDVVIRNATIWTSGKKGKLENHDILFLKGKVSEIGVGLKVSKSVSEINGVGKHITPGLIDCHSHSAAFSINEGTQSVTAEVRIQDVLNSDDITIYRELAGGLTMANILHGSANTIGGQNAVIKLRWGGVQSDILYENAMPGIKFALGENVKQANWGDDYTTRYPQTRMGVEQILRDAFSAAKAYNKEWKDYLQYPKKWKKKVPPRRDLELEALAEILEGKRQIHCHSYRQDEIMMLTRVAEDFGFTVGVFQHVLEGYKVADRLKEHGAMASTFSDWWAYKYEVIDAIPYNGTLMTDIGVNVSFNSDSRELARRMNTEAAKGVKYGGLSEEEALKLVTINPAMQLRVDQWVGSLEKGKDADFVIWSDHPLSTKAVCEQTWIDGRRYFSLELDQELKVRDNILRKKLTDKILSSREQGKKEWKHREEKSAIHHHCIEDEK